MSILHKTFNGKAAVFAALTMFLLTLACSARAQPLPVLQLAEDPLFSVRKLPPTLMLNISVEWPTTGAAYRSSNNFDPAKTYVGYFNNSRCYEYSTTKRYFVPGANAAGTNKTCSNQFSGNFLNWATMSSIDILRYSLTGGNRYIDTANTTVLERTFLRKDADNGYKNYQDTGNTNYFPRKILANANLYTPYSGTVYVTNCGIKIHFNDSDSKTGTGCDTPNDDAKLSKTQDPNGMLVRVSVCDQTEGPAAVLDSSTPPQSKANPSYNNSCSAYGANYKPEGQLQKNPLSVRVGVFGYALDNGLKRYGGVLRAKAKFVGPRQVDANLVESSNPYSEWDATTGVFIPNPDAKDTDAGFPTGGAKSGVISYLNGFGSANGTYKGTDPLGELYYESIRYLGNIGQTPEATADLTNDAYDGFPIYKWKDPFLASCQDAHSITIGDTNTHADRSVPGVSSTTFDDFARPLDAMGLDAREQTKRLFTDLGSTVVPSTIGVDDKQTCCNNNSRYMAGIAYWARSVGFRSMPNGGRMKLKSYFIDVQESSGTPYNQRQLYYSAIGGSFDDRNDNGKVDSDEWQERTNGAPTTITALNGKNSESFTAPLGYYLGGEPAQLIANIEKIFKDIGSQAGSITAPAFSSPVYDPAGTGSFRTSLDSKRWSGDLIRFPLVINNGVLSEGATSDWSAAKKLDERNIASSPRKFLIGIPDSAGSWSSAALGSSADVSGAWSSLSAAQKAALNKDAATGATDTYGQDRLAYLLGERTNEAPKGTLGFRERGSRLGDIVNAGALYVANPNEQSSDASYKAFAANAAQKGRTKMVYAGANDGMLHAFDASTGQELFAYIPNATFSKLNRLTNPKYAHTPFVDGPLFSGDAKTSYGGWKTILAGGFGDGAQGIFALDVTQPASIAASNVLFEFTDKDDKDIGYVTGAPKVVKLRRGTVNEWFLAVPSGYNNYQVDGQSNATGESFLFLLSLNRQPGTAWSNGSNYFKIPLPALNTTSANGLGGIGFDTNARQEVTAIYAGDLQGGLWKVDLSSDDSTKWKSAFPAGGGTPVPFARLRDAAGNAQPITSAPTVVAGFGDSKVVVVGTGRLLTDSDLSSPFASQSIYGIWDFGKELGVTNVRDRLQPRTVTTTTSGRTVDGAEISYGTTGTDRQGWYFDLPSSGERNVTGSVSKDGLLGLTTLIPSSSPCDLGSGWPYALDPVRGKSKLAGSLITDGFPGAPAFIEGPTSVLVGSTTDKIQGSANAFLVFGTGGVKKESSSSSGGGLKTLSIPLPKVWGMLNWREINNYQELKSNPNKAK